MTQLDPTMVLVEVVTLALAAGGLLVSFGRNKVKKEEVDNLALQVAVELAKKTPELEEKLRETIQQLAQALFDSKGQQDKLSEMEETIRLQAAEISQLKRENALLSDQLKQLSATFQTFQPSPHN